MARLNQPHKVHKRRVGALNRFKMQQSRTGKQSQEARANELARLTAKVAKGFGF